MDINKDIKTLNSGGYEELKKILETEEEDLRIRKYLFSVMDTIYKFEKLHQEGVFSKAGVCYINFEKDRNENRESVFTDIEFFNKDMIPAGKYSHGQHSEEYEAVCALIGAEEFILEEGLYGDLRKTNGVINLDLGADIKEQLKSTLLSEDLRKIFNYVELNGNTIGEENIKHANKENKKQKKL